MGEARISVVITAPHGCDRTAKDGEQIKPCMRVDCPDCFARFELVPLLRAKGWNVLEGKLQHWPSDFNADMPTIVDDLLTGKRAGQFP